MAASHGRTGNAELFGGRIRNGRDFAMSQLECPVASQYRHLLLNLAMAPLRA
jgi:hypothetical protein